MSGQVFSIMSFSDDFGQGLFLFLQCQREISGNLKENMKTCNMTPYFVKK